jgi:thiol-disulfide isomerase/thioredoxin
MGECKRIICNRQVPDVKKGARVLDLQINPFGKERNPNMQRFSVKAIVFTTFFSVLVASALAGQTPGEGGVLPAIRLETKDEAHRQYLGLKGEASFLLHKIKADVVIIEIFSMYCPICQNEAPVVNRLYGLIQDNPKTKGKVKLIGIGMGNSAFEVDVFKNTYKVPFPLFPDGDFAIHKQIGEVRTPYFFVIRMAGDGSHQLIYSKLGEFGDPAAFLETIVKKAGL